jgi:hypothetical protein
MPRMPTDVMIPIREINETFSYNKNSGDVFYKDSKRHGDLAGSVSKKTGYRTISFKGRTLQAHRLAFALYYQRWPDNFIDHINGDRDDNRIDNLQDVSHRENALRALSRRPKRKTEDGRTLEFGVFRHAPGYNVVKTSNGHDIYCGYFKDLDSANEKAKQMDEMLGLKR